jgi:hypothetical protein
LGQERLLAEYDMRVTIPGRESLTVDLDATIAAEAAEVIVVQLERRRGEGSQPGSKP